jgi:hypothetical protein
MGQSNGLGAIAIAGMVLAAGIGAAVLAEHLAGRDPLRCKEREHPTQAPGRAPNTFAPSAGAVETAYQTPDCSEPRTEKEDELCQQRRAASAAVESACISRWQFWVSLFGLGGLIGTIVYSARSARAASEAAVQMAREVDVQMRVEQPLLFIRNMTPHRLSLSHGAIRFVIENAGRTPAVLHSICTACEVGTKRPDQPIYGEAIRVSEIILDKGERWEYTTFVGGENRLDASLDGDMLTHLWGFVIYEDVFGRMRMTGFGYEGRANRLAAALAGRDQDFLQWQRFGEAAYNYDHDGHS